MGQRMSQKPQHTPPKNLENAELRPYNPLPHGFIWPLLGQKSSHKKCYRTEIFATSARVIWSRAVALPDGFTIPWLPSCTADEFLHHEQTAGKLEWLRRLAHSTIIITDVAAGSGGFGEVVRWWGGFARWY